jgi:hypothetical protein
MLMRDAELGRRTNFSFFENWILFNYLHTHNHYQALMVHTKQLNFVIELLLARKLKDTSRAKDRIETIDVKNVQILSSS